MTKNLAEMFAAIVGDGGIITDPGDFAAYTNEPRAKFHGTPAGIVRPNSTAEVAAIVKLAGETGTALVPQGGNTGLVGGQVTDDTARQWIVSLNRMTAITEVDATQNTMIAEAGATLQSCRDAAEQHGRLFPLSLASQGTCTIGGNLASNAGGLNVVAYGNAREQCLGLEVVLGTGEVWNGLNTLRKDNTGYDLKNLFIGAEGTLGIITRAALRLAPAIRHKATAMIALDRSSAALELLNLAQEQSGGIVTTIELMARLGVEMTINHANARDPFGEAYPWYVLLELSSPRDEPLAPLMEKILSTALQTGMVKDAAIAQSGREANEFWAIREGIPETQKHEGGSIKHDVSLPLSRLPEFLENADAAVRALIPGARPVPFGHVGDGNIHFNITQPKGADKDAFLARWGEVNAVVHAIVMDMGGSISAEHGIGQLKRADMAKIKSPEALHMMRGLKSLFDPKGIMNPGKVLP